MDFPFRTLLTIAVYILGFLALAYQIVAILAALFYRLESRLIRGRPEPASLPAISILKPVRGLDSGFERAIAGHATQDYPEFEILFGVHSLDDPAVPAIRALIDAHPQVSIRLLECKTATPNGKVGVLIDLLKEASHPVLVVNDSDISVPRDYLRRLAARLIMDKAALVTCPYRAIAGSAAGIWEAFGIAVDFVPSTLVAPLVGVREFGLGSTLCFRRNDLARAGGFESVASFIADDYQLAKRITSLCGGAVISEVVVQTNLSSPSWLSVWLHQLRWARTIRASRGGGFLGLPLTHAGVWIALAFACGLWSLAFTLLAARLAMAIVCGFFALESLLALLLSPLAPLWDLWAFAVWLCAFTGHTVEWRGQRFRLTHDGALERLNP
jgi:ceramide glucosyltransferase